MDESDGGPTVMHWFRERPTLLLWTRSASFLRCSMQGWSAVAGGWPDRLAVDGVAYGSARGGLSFDFQRMSRHPCAADRLRWDIPYRLHRIWRSEVDEGGLHPGAHPRGAEVALAVPQSAHPAELIPRAGRARRRGYACRRTGPRLAARALHTVTGGRARLLAATWHIQA